MILSKDLLTLLNFVLLILCDCTSKSLPYILLNECELISIVSFEGSASFDMKFDVDCSFIIVP